MADCLGDETENRGDTESGNVNGRSAHSLRIATRNFVGNSSQNMQVAFIGRCAINRHIRYGKENIDIGYRHHRRALDNCNLAFDTKGQMQ